MSITTPNSTVQDNGSSNKKLNVIMPILLSLSAIIGMYAGAKIFGQKSENKSIIIRNNDDAMGKILKFIDKKYVDTVNTTALYEDGIAHMLQQLDPFSVYIPAKDLQKVNEPLDGNFEGIGIEFYVLKDTVLVVTVLSGGPAESVGLKSGDKIINVDGKPLSGTELESSDVVAKLKGPKETRVKVQIMRNGSKDLLDFDIKRGKIPIHSMDIAYMVAPTVGYIKLNKFSATTGDEFKEGLKKLKAEGMEKLILDLRGNPGGYLNAAVEVVDEFLDDDKLVTYTQGRDKDRDEYNATRPGLFEKGNLAVLIDEGSASASEIVSGAVQDWDRGVIIGRRSFGKGLVQEQFSLPDGAALRLTVAKYYTPTGRCIQKPYSNGQAEDEVYARLKNGEFYNKDSIKHDEKMKYTTPKGHIVYGGGGITPDLFIPADSSRFTNLYSELLSKGLIVDFAYSYAGKNKSTLQAYQSSNAFVQKFTITEAVKAEFKAFLKQQKLKSNVNDYTKSKLLIETLLKANIGKYVWGDEAFYPVFAQMDNTLQKAVEAVK